MRLSLWTEPSGPTTWLVLTAPWPTGKELMSSGPERRAAAWQWSPKMMKSLSFDPDWTCQRNDFWIFKKRYKAAWMIRCFRLFSFSFLKMFCDKTEEIFLHHLYTRCILVKWINELEQRHGNYSIIPFIINF